MKRVRYKQRTATSGGTIAFAGDVRDIEEQTFSPAHHEEVPADTPLNEPRAWDDPEPKGANAP